jgi:hypothetical protein
MTASFHRPMHAVSGSMIEPAGMMQRNRKRPLPREETSG